MKRWIHASSVITLDIEDEYNVSRYLPKFCLPFIEEIDVESDFDYGKNRSVNHYVAYMRDGDRVSANGINAFVKAVKQYVVQNGKDNLTEASR